MPGKNRRRKRRSTPVNTRRLSLAEEAFNADLPPDQAELLHELVAAAKSTGLVRAEDLLSLVAERTRDLSFPDGKRLLGLLALAVEPLVVEFSGPVIPWVERELVAVAGLCDGLQAAPLVGGVRYTCANDAGARLLFGRLVALAGPCARAVGPGLFVAQVIATLEDVLARTKEGTVEFEGLPFLTGVVPTLDFVLQALGECLARYQAMDSSAT